jgi:hypothetical protein
LKILGGPSSPRPASVAVSSISMKRGKVVVD